MEKFTFIIPIITCVVLFLFFREKTVWWEYLVVIFPSLLLILAISQMMISSNTSDEEYLGHHIKKVRHYDEWDEWVKKRCSHTYYTGSGKNRRSHTTYYDCSYRKFHDEYWVMTDERGSETSIPKEYYNKLVQRFNTPSQFVDMHRRYLRIDGDAQDNHWSGSVFSVVSTTDKESYENKVQASKSVFKFRDVDEKDKARFRLYDYPEINELDYQQVLLGSTVQMPDSVKSKFDYVNGVIGGQKQIKVFVLYFYNQSLDVVKYQQSYWGGGNKNELIICASLDSVTKKLQWVDAFSWMDKPELEARIHAEFAGKDKLDLNVLADLLMREVPLHWKRKNFHDFDYLTIEITDNQFWWLMFIMLLVNTGISVWVIKNEFDKDYDEYKQTFPNYNRQF